MKDKVLDENDKVIVPVPNTFGNISNVIVDYSEVEDREMDIEVEDLIPVNNPIRPKSVGLRTDEEDNSRKIFKDVVVTENVDVCKKEVHIKKNDQGKLVAAITTTGDANRDINAMQRDTVESNYTEIPQNDDDEYFVLSELTPNQLMEEFRVRIDDSVVGDGSEGESEEPALIPLEKTINLRNTGGGDYEFNPETMEGGDEIDGFKSVSLHLSASVGDTITNIPVTENRVYTVEEFMYDPINECGLNKNSTFDVNVSSNNETWTNERIENNGTFTVSGRMNDPTKDGISKDSTIIVDIDTKDLTQISNYSITSNGSGQTIPIPNGYDGVDSISVNVNVPSNNEMVNNKTITSNGTHTVTELMDDSNNKDGVTKASEFQVNVDKRIIFSKITSGPSNFTYFSMMLLYNNKKYN